RRAVFADIECVFKRERHTYRLRQPLFGHRLIVHQQRDVCPFSNASTVVAELQRDLGWSCRKWSRGGDRRDAPLEVVIGVRWPSILQIEAEAATLAAVRHQYSIGFAIGN